MKRTKFDVIKQYSDQAKIPVYIARRQVNEMFCVLLELIFENETVMISGLGTFRKNGEEEIEFSTSKNIKKIYSKTKKGKEKKC